MIRYYSVPKETFVTNGTIVEPLTATENGTYAPPAGTAYSPVIVNVEGGGGSSDFSTAEVTVVNNSSYPCELKGSFIDAGANATVASITDEDGVGTIILYKGNAIMNAFSGEGPINTTASGGAHNLGGNAYMVTGDCTITIS